MTWRGLTAAVLAIAAASATACGNASDSNSPMSSGNRGLPQGSEPTDLNPADFSTDIDNPYLPLRPGSRWVYRETDTTESRQTVTVTVTHRTKRIANGVLARVVRDVATENGRTIEATDDWYAQDAAGNVWYLGEDTAEYRDGVLTSRRGSFEAGVDGAQAGIAMPGDPSPGLSYRQEYLKGEAEDSGAIVTVGEERVEVAFGSFAKDIVMTRDLVPTEPRVQELKFYAPGVGLVLSVHTDGDGGRAELVSYRSGG